MPRAPPAVGSAALHGAGARRRRAADRADRRAGIGVRPVRVTEDHGNAAKRGLERKPQAGGADLAAGRAEGAEETVTSRQLGPDDVLEPLSWLMATRGLPDHVRSDNGSEFTATAVRERLGKVGVKTH